MRNKILVGAGLSACALAWAAKDPVIMTVNGVDVPKSEFEYLYHKNSQQQLAPQPLAEYAEMFKIYKLKVADAKANGIDTTETFKKEMKQYRNELAAPFLTDSAYINKLVAEAVSHAQEEVEASHIMMLKSRDLSANAALRSRLDSIRNVILAGGDFTDLALRFSQDKSVTANKGYLGYISSGRFPYEFEEAAYNTPEGEVSEVIESPAGYHILLGGKHRPSRGKVEAAHIMKMTPKGASEADKAKAKAEIDSLYQVVKADPSRFAEIATKYSDDKGSARQGGKLPLFGSGEMVPEFEAKAFSLSDGEIGEPVQSMYGWHIIHKIGHKGAPTEDEMRPELLRRFANPQDGRFKLIKDDQTRRLALKHKGSINRQVSDAMIAKAKENGVDSTYMAYYLEGPAALESLFVIDGKGVPASELPKLMKNYKNDNPEAAASAVEAAINNLFGRQLMEAEEDWLYENEPDYRNLLNEYRDGSMLYEISVQKVWDKASKDTEGLQKYFNNHRGEYTWTEPHVKGFLIQASNDSVAALVKDRLNGLPADSLVTVVRKDFAGKAQIDRVLATKGTNPMIDNLVFGGPKVNPSSANYTVYFLYDSRILDAPEEMADVKGQVTSDYQTQLEELWINELKDKYPVKINEKELKKLK